MLWKDDCDMNVLNYSMNHIHASVNDSSFKGGEGLIIDVYGHMQSNRRYEVWNIVKTLGMGVTCPWLVFGEFN